MPTPSPNRCPPRTGPELRVLILGTGPVAAPPQIPCNGGSVAVTSCDAFSRLYREVAKATEFRPPHGFPEKLGRSEGLMANLMIHGGSKRMRADTDGWMNGGFL